MRNRKYLYAIIEFLEDDVVRKSSNRRSPRAARNERNPFGGGGRLFNVFESLEHLGDEAVGNRWVALAIPGRGFAELLTGGGLDSDAFSTLKYVRANLVEHDAPIFARMAGCVTRPPINLSGPGPLHVVVRLFETCHQLGRDEGTLIRLQFERLLKDVIGSVGHVVILTAIGALHHQDS